MRTGTLTITLHLGEDGVRDADDAANILIAFGWRFRDALDAYIPDPGPGAGGTIRRDGNALVGEWRIE